MANYGFKTSSESPLQHEMRKENATKWKPSPQQPMGKGGCRVRREERDEAAQPKAGSQKHCREPPYPGAHGGPHRDGGCDAAGRSRSQSLPAGSFLQRKSCYIRTGGARALPSCRCVSMSPMS